MTVVLFLLTLPASGQNAGWAPQTSNTLNHLYGVDFVSAETGWAVGELGTIMKTTDAGIQWSSQSVDPSYSLAAVDFVNSSIGWAVGSDTSGIILKTTNGGNTWNPSDAGVIYNGRYLTTVHFRSSSLGWAAGFAGLILKTTNGGSTWTDVSDPGVYADFQGIFFVDDTTGWVGGVISGTVLKTTDGGSSWTSQTNGISESDEIYSIHFVDQQTGWLVGYAHLDTVDVGLIEKTTDGGDSWVIQPIDVDQYLFSSAFVSDTEGWAVGGAGTILRTTDGGASWVSEPSSNAGVLEDISVPPGVEGWCVGDAGYILRRTLEVPTTVDLSVNSGWNIVSIPVTPTDPRKTTLFPTATSNAFAYQGTYVIKDTLFVGRGHWLKFSSTQSIPITGTPLMRDTIDVADGWNLIGSISQPVTPSSVTSIPPGLVTSQFFGYNGTYTVTDSIRPGQGYWVKVGQSGKIILSTGGSITARARRIRIMPSEDMPPAAPESPIPSVRSPSDNPPPTMSGPIPKLFSLSQNFPNPFNPSTMIEFDVPEPSDVRLSVFNILGQEIAKLVSGILEAGHHSSEWNSENNNGISFPSGVYICRIQARSLTSQRENVQIRKMALMK